MEQGQQGVKNGLTAMSGKAKKDEESLSRCKAPLEVWLRLGKDSMQGEDLDLKLSVDPSRQRNMISSADDTLYVLINQHIA